MNDDANKADEIYAIEDTAKLDNFDEILPPSSRAIQYPFELDIF
jgi:hypothetical protein